MMVDPTRKGALAYEFPIFVDQIEPEGFLNNEAGSHACWYYFCLAMANKQQVGDGPKTQIILEGELWQSTRYENIARGVAAMYGMESPSEFLKFMDLVKKEARRVGTEVPGEIEHVFPGMDRRRDT
jgi:hypothetical protein